MNIETAEGEIGMERGDEAVQLPGQGRSQTEFGNERSNERSNEGSEGAAFQDGGKAVAVLYHADCADGFAAAYCCWRKFGAGAVYLPVRYGEPMPKLPAEVNRVFIVDFSYSAVELIWLASKTGMRVTVLDHHKTAHAELLGLDESCCGNLRVTFNLEKSGAVLAWEHFFPGSQVPELLRYVEDRDLWRWELPNSREINAALALEPSDFERWHILVQDVEDGMINGLLVQGQAAGKLIQQTARRAAKQAVSWMVGGVEVPVLNCTAFISETCHEMLVLHPDAKFVGAYFDAGVNPRARIWSLRSRADFDVSVIARARGGGGHPQAAGFKEALA